MLENELCSWAVLILQHFRHFTYITALLQPFRRFTYVTAHSPTLPLLHLRHSSFSNPSLASPTLQLILQPFCRFTYVTGLFPTLPLLHLRHSSFSNPSFASPTSQALHLASRPWIDYMKIWRMTLYHLYSPSQHNCPCTFHWAITPSSQEFSTNSNANRFLKLVQMCGSGVNHSHEYKGSYSNNTKLIQLYAYRP